jgi:transmembrane sensor
MQALPKKRIWILLAKHFAAETTDGEEKEVREWRKDPGHNDLYDDIEKSWRNLKRMKTQFDTEMAWTRLHERMERNGQIDVGELKSVQQAMPFVRQYRRPLRIAAAVLLIAAAGFLLYATGILTGLRSGTVLVVTENNEEVRNVSLPDGSTVYLNSGTRFSYPKKFRAGTRTVSLTGEAYFEVAADAEHPFVIETGEALIKAVGTSFNVDASGDIESQVEVFVESGRVELIEAGDTANRVMIEPGYAGTLVHGNMESGISEDRNCIAWKTKQMDFHNTPLSEVVDILRDVYKVEIIIPEPGIDTTRIIGNYSDDPLELILEIICTQNNLKVEKSDQKIYLSQR